MTRVRQTPSDLPFEWGDLFRRSLIDRLRELFSGLFQAQEQSLIVACSDETTALTTGTAKNTFRMPWAIDLYEVRASLSTAQTSGSIFTVDINVSGSTILTTKLTIDNTEKTSETAATSFAFNSTRPTIPDDAEVTIDIDQVGDGTAKGLKVTFLGVRP